MKTTISLLSFPANISIRCLSILWRAHLFIISLILFGIQLGTNNSYAQSIVKLNNAGTNDWNFHNSVSDDQGNIYYCTRDARNNNTLIVSSINKALLPVWSYNYNIGNIDPVSGVFIQSGKIYITTSVSNDVILLELDLMGNVLFSKKQVSGNLTSASTVMHNNDIVISTSYNPQGSLSISRLTPTFTTVFNKRIQFDNRDFVYIDHIKQIGNRIYFGGSARTTSRLISYWFFGALELNGALAFLHEYEVQSNDQFPNNHFGEMDSVSTNLIITTGYSSDVNSAGSFNSHAYGVILKVDPSNGALVDHLVLTPQNNQDWMFFFGLKYQANNKIRISGAQGINLDFDNRGLLYGEVDLDFKSYQFKFSKVRGLNTWINRFTDYEHASGSLMGEAVLITAQGFGVCKSPDECFDDGHVISLNREINLIPNIYTLTDISYDVVDLSVLRKPIQVSLTINCGASTCEDSYIIQICKKHFEYDYSAIKENPSKVTNLTPAVASMIHDQINKKIIIDPIQSGTAKILMERQINIFIKQLDTFEFVILNDSLPVLDLGPDKVLCNGDSAVLSFGLDSIHWSDGSVRKSITVKKAGIYWGSFSNMCGSVADTIQITTLTPPKLNLGNDLLLCGNQPGTLSSNYDNTIWSNGASGRNIVVSTPGKIIGFVSTACGVSFDTVEVFKFDRNSFSAGPDLQTCDSIVNLNANFVNPNSKVYSSDVQWKQIDLLPLVTFSDAKILNPTISNLSKDKNHFFELSIRVGNSCTLKDTIKILSKNCLLDSCAIIVQKNCLPNGMVELKALDNNNQVIIPKTRVRELFWDIKDGPAGRGYSVTDKNPVIVSNYARYSLTSKIYSWRKGYPHTIEFADICERRNADSLSLNCTGPCEDFSFILSSCDDDYDIDNNLSFPPAYCKSVCENSCDYIVGIFGLDGFMVDPNFYTIKWSTGENGAVTVQKGCFNYVLTVEVRQGDCVWYGRYRPSCLHHNKGFRNEESGLKRSGPTSIDLQSLKILLNSNREFTIYNISGQYVGRNEMAFQKLTTGVYFIETTEGNQKNVKKIFINGNDISKN